MSSNIASSRYMLVISDLIEKSSAIVYNERSSEVVVPTLTNACPTLVTVLRQPSSDPMAATIKARPVITLRHRLFHPSLSTHAPSSAFGISPASHPAAVLGPIPRVPTPSPQP